MVKWNNEPISSITHFLGFLLSIAALVILVIFAVLKATAWHIVAFSIFGSALILLYLASSLYHFMPKSSKAKNVFRNIDHSMIYVLIAGTYTPICLTVLRGGLGWSIFGIIWGLAILGIVLKATGILTNYWLSTPIYIIMGWIIIIAIFPLIEFLPLAGLWWLIAGGILYTFGTLFLGLEKILKKSRWLSMHDIFHLFVLAASFSHFWFMFRYIMFFQ